MSAAGSGARADSSDGGPATTPPFTSQLVLLYDELAELEALNSFLYDAFLTLVSETEGAFSASSSSGLGLTCQWLRQRQGRLKQEFYQLIQRSKDAAGDAD
ncbi:MAG: hypothetical protein OIF34_03835 [Porticoccaceae bacterium]|nr:hypothetical protein [Porticoccaceae bacterium]